MKTIKEIVKKFLKQFLKTRINYFLDILHSDFWNIEIISLKLKNNTLLGAKGDQILIPFDNIMFPYVFQNGTWQEEEIYFLKNKLGENEKYCVFDIGANIGLFTIQLLNSGLPVDRVFCIEPSARNFSCLSRNIERFENVYLYNFGLGKSDEEMDLYLDKNNFGNYSLNLDAVCRSEYNKEKISVKSTEDFFLNLYDEISNRKIIWKSDTQGYDELIISLVPFDIWENVDLAIVELWRIKKPKFDADSLRERFSIFPNISLGHAKCSSVEDIFEFLDGDDYFHEDLYLWK